MNPTLAIVALEQGGVFTAAQAAAAGLDRQTRRDLVRDGTLRQLRRNVFTPGEYWDGCGERDRHRVESAGALIARGWSAGRETAPALAVGRMSAGFLHDLPLPRDDRADERATWNTEELRFWERRPTHIDLISADRGRRSYKYGVEVRPAALPANHVVLHGVVPIASLARTAVDLMREASRPEALMVADATLRRGVSRTELESMVNFCGKWPNAGRAREAVTLGDHRAESPAESVARLALIDNQIDFELQVDLYDAAGHIGRVDLLLRAFGIILEVDGHVKMLDPWHGTPEEARRRQEERERRLTAAGWIVLRTTWEEVFHYPDALVERIRAAASSVSTLI